MAVVSNPLASYKMIRRFAFKLPEAWKTISEDMEEGLFKINVLVSLSQKNYNFANRDIILSKILFFISFLKRSSELWKELSLVRMTRQPPNDQDWRESIEALFRIQYYNGFDAKQVCMPFYKFSRELSAKSSLLKYKMCIFSFQKVCLAL